jgi:PTH1 family peptidyl-tRNA hydrolase
MNKSGAVVPRILSRFSLGPENLLVLCDTMDLPAGTLRLKMKGSSGGQKGLASVISVLGTENFMRLYIGIGRPAGDTISHVLGIPEEEDACSISAAAGRAAEAALRLLVTPPEGVMNEINAR